MTKSIKAYLLPLSQAQRREIARKVGCTLGHLNNLTYGFRTVAPKYAPALERVTGISRKHLRPKDWKMIWPELK